jgi:hypothetical protein
LENKMKIGRSISIGVAVVGGVAALVVVLVTVQGVSSPGRSGGAAVVNDPRATRFDRRELSPEDLILFESLPESSRRSIASLPRADDRAFMIRLQSTAQRMDRGEAVDLSPFVEEMCRSREWEEGVKAETALEYRDRLEESVRVWGPLMLLTMAIVTGRSVPEWGRVEARTVEVLERSVDDTERAHAIMLLWAVQYLSREGEQSERVQAALTAGLRRGDAIPSHLARLFLGNLGVSEERLKADFDPLVSAARGGR